jgi:hypothetical protein
MLDSARRGVGVPALARPHVAGIDGGPRDGRGVVVPQSERSRPDHRVGRIGDRDLRTRLRSA